MKRTRAERRHHRARIIARRLEIIRHTYYRGAVHEYERAPLLRPDGSRFFGRPIGLAEPWVKGREGLLSKFNLNCTCRLCKRSKPRYDRARERQWERQLLDEW